MIGSDPVWLAGPFAFAITFAENWVSSRERNAEKNSRTANTRRWSIVSANWSTAFEVILLVDILLTVAEPVAIFPWVVVGGWLGQFLACEKTRRKFQAKKFQKGQSAPKRRRKVKDTGVDDAATDGSGGSGGSAGGAG